MPAPAVFSTDLAGSRRKDTGMISVYAGREALRRQTGSRWAVLAWCAGGTPPNQKTLMSLKNLHDLFVHELRDLFDAENQLWKALPAMAQGANSPQLKKGFEVHLRET
ncbi:MAG: DUF892 family protein, partial [Gemmatimonadetes bacterium]|nr:DUF892 family protein [Gemmatimonadota bacterium]